MGRDVFIVCPLQLVYSKHPYINFHRQEVQVDSFLRLALKADSILSSSTTIGTADYRLGNIPHQAQGVCICRPCDAVLNSALQPLAEEFYLFKKSDKLKMQAVAVIKASISSIKEEPPADSQGALRLDPVQPNEAEIAQDEGEIREMELTRNVEAAKSAIVEKLGPGSISNKVGNLIRRLESLSRLVNVIDHLAQVRVPLSLLLTFLTLV